MKSKSNLIKIYTTIAAVFLCAVIFYTTTGLLEAGSASGQTVKPKDTAIASEANWQFVSSLNSGWTNYSKGDYQAALNFYSKAANDFPNSINPLLGKSNCYWALKMNDESKKAAKAVLDIDPMNYTANKRLGDLAFQEYSYDVAIGYYSRVLKLYPEDFTIMTSYAWCLLLQGKTSDAKAIFAKMVEISPDFKLAKDGLAECDALAKKKK